MAHEIDLSNDRVNIAYSGELPWHGLGRRLEPGKTIEEWRSAAGMDWEILGSPVRFVVEQDGSDLSEVREVKGQRVLYRADTKQALSIVSDGYKIVQPEEILEFYRDLAEAGSMQLEVAGCLYGGRYFWALAKISDGIRLKGQDLLLPYCLVATSCDRTMATIVKGTVVRVVCNNTLRMSLGSGDEIRIPHSVEFDANKVKAELGLLKSGWKTFTSETSSLAERTVSKEEALKYFIEVLVGDEKVVNIEKIGKKVRRLFEVYEGGGRGQEVVSAAGSAWGLVNAVTYMADHETRFRTADSRMWGTTMGGTADKLKTRAYQKALALAA